MKNILVPIGTSENSHKTLQYAIDFAKEFGSNVLVMEAYTAISMAGRMANVDEVVERSSSERLDEIINMVDRKDVSLQKVTYKGDVVNGVQAIDKELGVDLIILAPRSTDIREEVFLGNTSGSIIKQTNIPALIVPKDVSFTPFKTILTAAKSGKVYKPTILDVLKAVKDKFNTRINLLLVKTPNYTEEDLVINEELKSLSTEIAHTENATTFQGVLERFTTHNPDVLCVFRRKRGFFVKLWEKNIILKREFHSSIPLLVLSVKTN